MLVWTIPSSLARKKVANATKGHAGFGCFAHLLFKNFVERYLAVEQLIEIEAVHTDNALASAEGDEAIIREAAVAHEQAPRPGCLLFNLAVERMQIGDANWLTMPFSFQQIGLAAELEAAVDLLTAKAERLLSGQTECVEHSLEESLEGKTTGLSTERGDL